jgi:hypothetical protein
MCCPYPLTIHNTYIAYSETTGEVMDASQRQRWMASKFCDNDLPKVAVHGSLPLYTQRKGCKHSRIRMRTHGQTHMTHARTGASADACNCKRMHAHRHKHRSCHSLLSVPISLPLSPPLPHLSPTHIAVDLKHGEDSTSFSVTAALKQAPV